MSYGRCQECGQKVMEDEDTCFECADEARDCATFEDEEIPDDDDSEMQPVTQEVARLMTLLQNPIAAKSEVEK